MFKFKIKSGNISVEVVSLDVKFSFTCGESNLHQNIVKFQKVMGIRKYNLLHVQGFEKKPNWNNQKANHCDFKLRFYFSVNSTAGC